MRRGRSSGSKNMIHLEDGDVCIPDDDNDNDGDDDDDDDDESICVFFFVCLIFFFQNFYHQSFSLNRSCFDVFQKNDLILI